jgi:pSer/pThr/pTyr-binding forkhead associated (FHA) protein
MKLSLVVAEGAHKGKVIPISLAQFLIGRDPQCHLRPASSMISKRHCALLVRNGKVLVRDFSSTNGTFVNDEKVEGEADLNNDDQLKIGPLLFFVKLETTVSVDKPTPVPPTTVRPDPKIVGSGDDDESIAAMLLDVQEDGGKAVSAGLLGGDGVPTGSTVLDAVVPSAEDTTQGPGTEEKPGLSKKQPAKPAMGNTSAAAKAILDKYTRRPRT